MEIITSEQIKIVYPNYISHRIYIDSNERRMISISMSAGKTVNKQYAKVLMEIKYGRILGRDETVDHIDRDKLNDTYSNLKILDRSLHASLDALRVKVEDAICPECSKIFTPTVNQRNSKKNKAGPFCSRSCTGKYGAMIQKGGDVMKRNIVKKIYYKINK